MLLDTKKTYIEPWSSHEGTFILYQHLHTFRKWSLYLFGSPGSYIDTMQNHNSIILVNNIYIYIYLFICVIIIYIYIHNNLYNVSNHNIYIYIFTYIYIYIYIYTRTYIRIIIIKHTHICIYIYIHSIQIYSNILRYNTVYLTPIASDAPRCPDPQ